MYSANTDRYQEMIYNRLGASGLKISAVSLGLWHNFGSVDSLENQKKIIHQAFDLGITYYAIWLITMVQFQAVPKRILAMCFLEI